MIIANLFKKFRNAFLIDTLVRLPALTLVVVGLLIGTSAYAQFTDDFSDGDFTNNPTWTGDDSIFVVNGSNQLQSNGFAQSDTAFLATPSSPTFTDTITWEFYLSMGFSPSNNNNVRVFLASDQANLQGSLNGYYIRIGESGSADAIKLYSQSGTSSTLILTGTGNIYPTNPVARIKVVRDPSANWTIYSDSTGGTNYVVEGTVNDNTFSSSVYFGVWCKYTASNSTAFIFDDFNVTGSIFVDTVAPAISGLTVISSTQLDVQFSEFVEQTSAETTTNYSVDNGIGNPSSAVRDAIDSTLVHLIFGSAFSNGTTYNLTVSNVQDLAANAITSQSQQFTYSVPESATYKDVVFNELLPDPTPSVGLPDGEFLELYNNSSKVFDLNGWQLVNTTTAKSLPSYVLQPGSFVILCSTTDTANYITYGDVIGISSWTALTNGGDSLTLLDDIGKVIDIVAYDDSWYNDATKDDGGWTLELINPNHPCGGVANWTASNNASGGTPGTQNSVFDTLPDTQAPDLLSANIISTTQILLTFSETMDSTSLANGIYTLDNGLSVTSVVISSFDFSTVLLTVIPSIDTAVTYTITVTNVTDCYGNAIGINSAQFVIGDIPATGDVIINEIFPDPTPSVGLYGEFLELYNNSSKNFDLSGWQLVNSTTAKTLSSHVLQPNGFVILCSTTDSANYSTYGDVIGISSWTSLTNGGDSLTLLDDVGTVLDIVAYDVSWYNDATKDDGGWTLELINPNHPCGGAGNWAASNSFFGGTPGTQNSIFDTLPDILPPEIQSVISFSLTQVKVYFNEQMDSASLANASYSIDNGITVSTVQPVSPDYQSTILSITPILDSSTVYTLSVSGASDCSGNTMVSGSIQFSIGVAAAMFDVVINEILPDPDINVNSLPGSEFVELYNRTSKAIRLDGYQFSDGTSTTTISSATMLPNSYLILTASSDLNDYTAYGTAIGLSSWPSLNNSGDDLTLRDDKGKLIHAVSYDDSWYGDETKDNGGWTLEMIDPDNPCGESDNWKASNDASGGTPGKQNSVYGSNPDNSSPILLQSVAESTTEVMLTFNEMIDSASALNAIYSINNGITVSSISIESTKKVKLTLGNSLQNNVVYTVSISGINDCVGNNMILGSADFALPEYGEPGDLIINEVLFNPRNSGTDFVEIYNNSMKFISLKNWQLANIDDDTIDNQKIIIAEHYTMFPGDYILLSKEGQNVLDEYPFGIEETFLEMSSIPTYSNDSGTVILINDSNVVVDRFSYDEDMHFKLLNDEDGVSLERIDFDRPSSDVTNWHSAAESVGFATPGYENSQFLPAEITADNVTIEPEVFSPDNDGLDDVVNINYKFDKPGFVASVTIYDSRGRLINALVQNELLGTEGTFSWDGIADNNQKARIGIHVIYFEAFDLDGNMLKFKKPCVVAGRL